MKRILLVCGLMLMAWVGVANAGYDRVTCPSGYTEIPDVGVCRRNDGQHQCPVGFDGYDLHVDDNIPNDGWGCFCQSAYTNGSGECVMPPTTGPDLTSCDTRAWKAHGITMTGICYADCDTGFWTPACEPGVWWQDDHQVYVGSEALLYRDRINTKLYLFNDFGDLPEPCGIEGFFQGAGSVCYGGWHPSAGLVSPGVPAPQANASWYQFKWN